MKKIGSFEVDHRLLTPQVRLSSRRNYKGTDVTVFDIRLRKPNTEAIPTGTVHALEHLLATALRSRPEIDELLIDISPMGCRTGFYMSLFGKLDVPDAVEILRPAFEQVVVWEGPVPGATEIECGNYRDHDLAGAKKEAQMFLDKVLNKKN